MLVIRIWLAILKLTNLQFLGMQLDGYRYSSYHVISFNLLVRQRAAAENNAIMFQTTTNSGHQTDALYFDFRKTFCSVPRNELLLKLKSMDISGNLWSWFQFHLISRVLKLTTNTRICCLFYQVFHRVV